MFILLAFGKLQDSINLCTIILQNMMIYVLILQEDKVLVGLCSHYLLRHLKVEELCLTLTFSV